jgi:hypothetical protein
MTNKLNPHKLGLAIGITLGLWHACWSVLVALGLAQVILDAILELHMLQVAYSVLPFAFWSAFILVLFTTAVGYVAGYTIGLIWNQVHSR